MKRLVIALCILAFFFFLIRNRLCHTIQLLDQTGYAGNLMSEEIDTTKTALTAIYEKALHNPSNTAFASDIDHIYHTFTDASQYTEYLSGADKLEQPLCDTLFNKIRTCYSTAQSLTLSDAVNVRIQESGQKIMGPEMEKNFPKLKKSRGANLMLYAIQVRLLEDGIKCLQEYAGRR